MTIDPRQQTEQNEFEQWYSDVYLPEQTFEPTQKEKAKVRFIFEEGLYYRKSKIDAANNRVCVWSAYENLGVAGVDYNWHKTGCGESFPSDLAYHNYCINCGGKIEAAE